MTSINDEATQVLNVRTKVGATDGGISTLRSSYEEHLRYVHPYLTGKTYAEAGIQCYADENVKHWRAFDCDFHAWSQAGFEKLLEAAMQFAPFKIEATVFVVNENIFVLRKLAAASALS